MNPRVASVKTLENFRLLLTFTNGEVRVFNMTPYLDIGIFKELKDIAYFRTAKVCLGTVQWQNEQDLCPETLYLDSVPVELGT
ncbi:MAG: DUF2442 domain-containing protein [Ignavibacteria bacterium]|nr:DUF2442 domain-containing protein [Ignavibacteria bacterium]